MSISPAEPELNPTLRERYAKQADNLLALAREVAKTGTRIGLAWGVALFLMWASTLIPIAEEIHTQNVLRKQAERNKASAKELQQKQTTANILSRISGKYLPVEVTSHKGSSIDTPYQRQIHELKVSKERIIKELEASKVEFKFFGFTAPVSPKISPLAWQITIPCDDYILAKRPQESNHIL